MSLVVHLILMNGITVFFRVLRHRASGNFALVPMSSLIRRPCFAPLVGKRINFIDILYFIASLANFLCIVTKLSVSSLFLAFHCLEIVSKCRNFLNSGVVAALNGALLAGGIASRGAGGSYSLYIYKRMRIRILRNYNVYILITNRAMLFTKAGRLAGRCSFYYNITFQLLHHG